MVRATITAFDTVSSVPPLDVSGSELLRAGAVRHEVGGIDLFLGIERLTAPDLPVTLEGEVSVPIADARGSPAGVSVRARARRREGVDQPDLPAPPGPLSDSDGNQNDYGNN